MMNPRSGLLLFVMWMVASPLFAATFTGEVVDTYCYAKGRIAGAAHTACALKCAKGGIPLALLEDKTHKVYLLLPEKDAAPLPAGLVSLAGKRVSIDGDLLTTSGSTFLKVTAFRAAK
jgi:hypothetical protein